MHPKLEKYFEKRKNDILISLGLFEYEYAGEDSKDIDFPEQIWDNKLQKWIRRRKVAIQVTEEEYAKILQSQVAPLPITKKENKRNGMAVTFQVLGWLIIVVGFITGVLLGKQGGDYSNFSFSIAILYWAIAFVSGLLFTAIGTIIQLLEDIKNK